MHQHRSIGKALPTLKEGREKSTKAAKFSIFMSVFRGIYLDYERLVEIHRRFGYNGYFGRVYNAFNTLVFGQSFFQSSLGNSCNTDHQNNCTETPKKRTRCLRFKMSTLVMLKVTQNAKFPLLWSCISLASIFKFSNT